MERQSFLRTPRHSRGFSWDKNKITGEKGSPLFSGDFYMRLQYRSIKLPCFVRALLHLKSSVHVSAQGAACVVVPRLKLLFSILELLV